jgi:hypothetical protein
MIRIFTWLDRVFCSPPPRMSPNMWKRHKRALERMERMTRPGRRCHPDKYGFWSWVGSRKYWRDFK